MSSNSISWPHSCVPHFCQLSQELVQYCESRWAVKQEVYDVFQSSMKPIHTFTAETSGHLTNRNFVPEGLETKFCLKKLRYKTFETKKYFILGLGTKIFIKKKKSVSKLFCEFCLWSSTKNYVSNSISNQGRIFLPINSS